MLQTAGITLRAPGKSSDETKNRIAAWNMHEALLLSTGRDASREYTVGLELFHMLREMRNAQIYSAGAIEPSL